MGKNSAIGWTHHTQNFWWGCTEVSAACDFCYARIFSERLGKAMWGTGQPRMRTSPNNWKEPFRWNRSAEKAGVPARVFCQSMSDFLDNEVPDEWRDEAWPIIRDTKWLRWMILSKRVGNAEKMLPTDWGPAYSHVGFMATIANQEEADRDIPKLLALKGNRQVTWAGISVEPMLGPIDLSKVFAEQRHLLSAADYADADKPGNCHAMYASAYALDLVIIGGESGDPTKVAIRKFDIDAARALKVQCEQNGIAVFMKQLGALPTSAGRRIVLKHKKGEDMAEWPQDLRVQQFPTALET